MMSSVAHYRNTLEFQTDAKTPGCDSICSVRMCNFLFSLSLASIPFCFVFLKRRKLVLGGENIKENEMNSPKWRSGS